MIEKLSGRVTYAVMSFGGFGLAHSHYPVPWAALKYDTGSGYATGITEQQLKDAPEFSDDFWVTAPGKRSRIVITVCSRTGTLRRDGNYLIRALPVTSAGLFVLRRRIACACWAYARHVPQSWLR